MDEVRGGIFIRFAEVLVGLPMLSLFHIGSPCGERESFQTRILGSYKFSSLSVRLDSGRCRIIPVSYPPKDFRVLT